MLTITEAQVVATSWAMVAVVVVGLVVLIVTEN